MTRRKPAPLTTTMNFGLSLKIFTYPTGLFGLEGQTLLAMLVDGNTFKEERKRGDKHL